MFKVRTYNQISKKGLERLPVDSYSLQDDCDQADAILLRSYKMQEKDISPTVRAIARAGAGVNNIPLDVCTTKGIPVFNAPGANANAVKELVLAGMLLSSRGILSGIDYVNSLQGQYSDAELSTLLEAEKKRFKGGELAGRTLGVVGLGAIGSRIADMALSLGMKVLGYDPALSVEAAWRLPSSVERMDSMAAVMSHADFITLHLPVLESTINIINSDILASCNASTVLLNFSREQIVDTSAIVESLESGNLGKYISDFPSSKLMGRKDCILMPHIGASTDEAEDNCAVMVAEQLRDFLENGNITNAVNFPSLKMFRDGGFRLTLTNDNVPKILGNITTILADANINVIDLLNKSRGEIAYNIIDVTERPSAEVLASLSAIEGVINVRLL
ncbi:D-3-phosphoglycerate dehydrogenase [Sinobacterium caligoides]|uniref:D-3-phosphoglycerate dehydrogenase n=1 Tax=Sinobacterium caligoides TaxID=933926 RepID=A0A3N2DK08_9GAMM|nr:phosphoglycerate dehydrogenase [Sinobacterium caligoides]ROS00019.1 D-3-phosphoglycerate dehydrogenase [Sinobacterium caligoides]